MKPRDKFSPSNNYSPNDDFSQENYDSYDEFSPPGEFSSDQGYGPPGPPGSELQLSTGSQKPTYALVMAILFFVVALILIAVSKKIPRFNKLKWVSLVSIIVSGVLAVIFLTSGSDGIKAVKAPKLKIDRIIGVREPEISIVSEMLDNDSEKLKSFGINTISLSPKLEVLPGGAIEDTPKSENDLKLAINKAHNAGFQVYLELAPIKTFSYSIKNPSILETTMKRLITKYAKVAEDFNVAFYSPISDSMPHPDKKKLNTFMQNILPKAKDHYSGNVVYHKQNPGFDAAKEITDDHVIEFEFMITGIGFNIASRYDYYNKKGDNIIFSIDEEAVSVSKFSEGGRLFKEHRSIEKNTWHKGRIIQKR